MHLVFVPPATGLVNAWKNTQVPTGLLILAAIARQRGWTVAIDDGVLHFPSRRDAVDSARRILAEKPDVVGFSAWCHTFPAQIALAEALRAEAPDLPIVFGGPHASVTDTRTLETFPFVDMVLRGEAEHSFPVLLDALARGGGWDDVPGLSYRSEGAIVRNPAGLPPDDLDALPTRPTISLRSPPGSIGCACAGVQRVRLFDIVFLLFVQEVRLPRGRQRGGWG